VGGTASGAKRREFAYGRSFFVQRLLLFSALAAVILGILGLQFATPPEWLAGFGVIFAVYILIWGLSPLFTNHWLTTTRLILRQGWYFSGRFLLRDIESVAKFEGHVPLGLRAPLGRHRLYVTGSQVGLVTVKLREPRRFVAVLGASADEIVFDVDSQDAFLEAFGVRKGSLAPVQTKRSDTYLRD